jgi:hypothetical protein
LQRVAVKNHAVPTPPSPPVTPITVLLYTALMVAPAAVKLVAGPKFEPMIVINSLPVVRSPERGTTSNTIGAAYDVVASVDIALLWPPTMTTHECDAPTPATVVHVIVV